MTIELSPDQEAALEAVYTWIDSGKPLLKLGGLAGCLSGGTIVKYRRGRRINFRDITLYDMYLKFNGHKVPGVRGRSARWDVTYPTQMLSLWPDGHVRGNRIVAVLESGVKDVVRVDFNNGTHLVATPDHPIATPGQEYVAAGELRRGSVVLGKGALLAKDGRGRNLDARPPRVVVNTKYHPTGAVKYVWCNGIQYRYMRVARARLVVEAAMNKLPYDEFVHVLKHNAEIASEFKFLTSDVDVHHMDENTLNDDIRNLEVLPAKVHARLHGRAAETGFHKEHTREINVTRVRKVGRRETYDVQMEPPANNFVANGIFVHNSGKTTLVSHFASESSKDMRIAFVAYTGRAASLLARKFKAAGVLSTAKTQLPAKMKMTFRASEVCYAPDSPESKLPFVGTIHRLLYRPVIDAMTEELRGWAKRDQLDRNYDLIVIDEASMVGEDVYGDFKRFETPILAVGDHGQLPPVMSSGGLMLEPDIRLEKIHRQAEGNPVIALAHHIRSGGTLLEFRAKKLGKSVDNRVEFANKQEVGRVLEEVLPRGMEAVVICWTNRMRVRLNGMARAALGIKGSPRKGDLVVSLKNYPPVMNGMRGILKDDSVDGGRPWHVNFTVDFPEEEITDYNVLACAPQFNREKTYASVDELQERGMDVMSMSAAGQFFDFGYALTCHKMQGSQAAYVVVYLDRPEDPDNDDYRRWMYTACTRSSHKLYCLR